MSLLVSSWLDDVSAAALALALALGLALAFGACFALGAGVPFA